MRAATPGTILILAACILLALVTCSTPVVKSISFLSARIGGSGNQAGDTIELGCLGYCIGSACVGPTIGYSFDPTQLLGVTNNVQGVSIDTSRYSTALIKGLTYTLVLHPIALGACVLTFIFGLLAHCGDMSLRCMNGFFSGIASFITLIAVGCDFALFIIAQKRINAVSGASASLGSALWMTLVAWILIILSSFSFCCSCCGSSGGSRKHRAKGDAYDDDAWKGTRGGTTKSDQMRMDAIDAEADRKRRNNLPKFATYETEHIESQPLTHDYEGSGGQQQVRFVDTSTNGGHAYHHPPYGYSEGHTPVSEHDPYSYGYGQGISTPTAYPTQNDNYIPGVGSGAPRTVPAATAYYDSSSSAPFSDTTQAPSTYSGANAYNDNGSTYSHGTYRAPSVSSSYSRGQTDGNDYYNAQGAPPVPAVPSSYADPRYQQRQASYGQGYPEASHYAEPSYTSQQAESPYDAIRQATQAGSQTRTLPSASTSGHPDEVIYSPSSRQASAFADSTGRSGDDGFGLSVLQAGIAARAANTSSTTRHTNEDYIASPIQYGNEETMASTVGSPGRSRPLPTAPSNNSLSQPPEYSSESETDAYGGISSRDYNPPSQHYAYPHEKR